MLLVIPKAVAEDNSDEDAGDGGSDALRSPYSGGRTTCINHPSGRFQNP